MIMQFQREALQDLRKSWNSANLGKDLMLIPLPTTGIVFLIMTIPVSQML